MGHGKQHDEVMAGMEHGDCLEVHPHASAKRRWADWGNKKSEFLFVGNHHRNPNKGPRQQLRLRQTLKQRVHK